MKYVLDAAVAVASLSTTEPHHASALRRCMPLFAGTDDIVVPALFDVEVFSALVRRGAAPTAVTALFQRHLATRKLVTLGPRAVEGARAVAAVTRLRAADSFYVWVAAREGLSLVTLDQEILGRAALAGVTALPP